MTEVTVSGLRVIREILFFEPKKRGTDLNLALEFLTRVTPHKAIAVVVSDFLGQTTSDDLPKAGSRRQSGLMLPQSLAQASFTAIFVLDALTSLLAGALLLIATRPGPHDAPPTGAAARLPNRPRKPAGRRRRSLPRSSSCAFSRFWLDMLKRISIRCVHYESA